MHYPCTNTSGNTPFCTVNRAEQRFDQLERYIDDLHAAMKTVKDAHSFTILAMVLISTLMMPHALHKIAARTTS